MVSGILNGKYRSVRIRCQIAVSKCCVGQTVAKWKTDRFFNGFKIAITDIQTFPVFGVAFFGRKIWRAGTVFVNERIGFA